MRRNSKERITITKIKKHPFYLKGKEKFESVHPQLVKEEEQNYSKNEKNNYDSQRKRKKWK